MNVTFSCPHCREPNRANVGRETMQLTCAHCDRESPVPHNAWSDTKLLRCLVCHCDDLFARKDFPQRLGIALVVIGFVGFLVSHYFDQTTLAFGFLFVTAGIDLLLYMLMGEAVVCYRCNAHYRGLEQSTPHGGFDLETHERYRQLEARQKELGASASLPAEDTPAMNST